MGNCTVGMLFIGVMFCSLPTVIWPPPSMSDSTVVMFIGVTFCSLPYSDPTPASLE